MRTFCCGARRDDVNGFLVGSERPLLRRTCDPAFRGRLAPLQGIGVQVDEVPVLEVSPRSRKTPRSGGSNRKRSPLRALGSGSPLRLLATSWVDLFDACARRRTRTQQRRCHNGPRSPDSRRSDFYLKMRSKHSSVRTRPRRPRRVTRTCWRACARPISRAGRVRRRQLRRPRPGARHPKRDRAERMLTGDRAFKLGSGRTSPGRVVMLKPRWSPMAPVLAAGNFRVGQNRNQNDLAPKTT